MGVATEVAEMKNLGAYHEHILNNGIKDGKDLLWTWTHRNVVLRHTKRALNNACMIN
jgi:hypothetical protein